MIFKDVLLGPQPERQKTSKSLRWPWMERSSRNTSEVKKRMKGQVGTQPELTGTMQGAAELGLLGRR